MNPTTTTRPRRLISLSTATRRPGLHAIIAALAVGCGSQGLETHGPSEGSAANAPHPSHASHAPHDHAHGHHPGGGHHVFDDPERWTQVFDDPARDAWQRPDEVLRAMDLEPSMAVADVGAGTGYFALRLARVLPRGEVIAIDLEPEMLRFLAERAQREGLTNLRTLQGNAVASGLDANSVDRILIVNVWHHLADRVAYARDLAAALKPGGRLFIVDFQLSAQRGPPAQMRLAPEAIIAELERAGLSASLSPVVLPDQYIVVGHRRP
ncbi:MAG TPA: class I SAM-dependent methyltransferase [Myxococcota bacterium]|nr:class I SAM-dependent methyltransferase [Myxococcota bacterium]